MKTTIIFAPHMDDEIIGCGGLIIKNMREKNKVVIVYMIKDEVRKQESKNLMKRFGLEKNLTFMDYTKLDRETVKDALAKIKKIIEKEKPQEVYVPAYEGGHMMHDLTNYIVNKAVEKSKNKPAIYEYPTYNNYPWYLPVKLKRRYATRLLIFRINIFPPLFIPHKTKKNILRMSKNEINMKKQMLRGYKSQNKNDYLVKNFLYKDRFRKCPRYDYTKKPHGMLPLNYEMVKRGTFSQFREAINI